MLEVLQHRGRDDRQLICAGLDATKRAVFVGFNRLAIVATAAGHQPVKDSAGTLVFNGEIYNWAELSSRVSQAPQCPSEAAVLASVIHEFPRGFWRFLDGSYALVYVDTARRRVVLSRDFLGIIPLYRERHGLGVASERKALQNPIAVRAGETLWLDYGGRVRRRHQQDYYSLHLEPVDLDHLEMLFYRAVARRITHSERPVCLALSGGLDSALVLAVARLVHPQIEAVTVAWDETSEEVTNAVRLCQEWGIQHRVVQLQGEIIDVPMLEAVLEDRATNPIKWRGFLRNYFVARDAPGTVILCGEGADELGSGYPSHERAGGGLQAEWKRLSTLRSMPAINLDRVNLGGMAWTKEYRTPFLDRALVLYLLGCAGEPKKGIWVKLARRLGVPEYIIQKPKYTSEEEALSRVGGV
jgi:asparagine synthase (glutamine-hydrolysing)